MFAAFEQVTSQFETASIATYEFCRDWGPVLLALIHHIDPVCAGYAVVAAILLCRAVHFHKSGKPEHMQDCAIHGVLAAFIAIIHQL
jgi:hypothetical protein